MDTLLKLLLQIILMTCGPRLSQLLEAETELEQIGVIVNHQVSMEMEPGNGKGQTLALPIPSRLTTLI